MTLLSYCWRWIGTATSFALFGIGSLILGVFVVPVIVLFVRDPERRSIRVRMVIGYAMKLFVFYMHRVGVLTHQVTGLENFDPDESYLIIANHPSLIDAVFLLSYFPTADCIIKQSVVNNFLTHTVVQAADYIPNLDSVSLLEESVERLKRGRSLILFPEGTRTQPNQLPEFKAGAATMAVRSGRRCLPVIIHIEPTTLTRSDRWYQVPMRRVFFSMSIQEPISAESFVEQAIDLRAAGRSFSSYLQGYFNTRIAGKC